MTCISFLMEIFSAILCFCGKNYNVVRASHGLEPFPVKFLQFKVFCAIAQLGRTTRAKRSYHLRKDNLIAAFGPQNALDFFRLKRKQPLDKEDLFERAIPTFEGISVRYFEMLKSVSWT